MTVYTIYITPLAWIYLLLNMNFFLSAISGSNNTHSDGYYPQNIPHYPIRKDIFTGQPVSTGRMHLIGGFPSDIKKLKRDPNSKKFSLKEFQEQLQCSPNEPSLNEFTGAVSSLRLIPPQKRTLELMCVWAETRCEPWSKCQEYLPNFQSGKHPEKLEIQRFDFLQNYRLIRIMNGSIYYDWPYGKDRIDPRFFAGEMHYALLIMIANKVSDLPDSTFFFGSERPYLPWNFPFPALSFAPAMTYNNLPWPWFESYAKEWEVYKAMYPHHIQQTTQQPQHRNLGETNTNMPNNHQESSVHASAHRQPSADMIAQHAKNTTQHLRKHYETIKSKHPHLNTFLNASVTTNHPKQQNPAPKQPQQPQQQPDDLYDSEQFLRMHKQQKWSERIPKAAFFASCDRYRQFIFEQTRAHPEVLDAKFSFHPYCSILPLNPLSNETIIKIEDKEKAATPEKLEAAKSLPSGYAWPLVYLGEETSYVPGAYKYVVTMLGTDARSTSGRLASLLAHSGAVILLSKSSFFYHFSAELQPWVHYVPIAFSGADIVEKIQWLQDHDDLAQRIVQNAKHFARSYLRLEDYYCFGAYTLEVLGEIMHDSDVLQPFNATELFVD